MPATQNTGIVGKSAILSENGEKLSKICSSRWYVYENTPVKELIDYHFNAEKQGNEGDITDIDAIAVVDENKNAKGILILQDINSLLSRQFGREILGLNPVSEFMISVPSFRKDSSIIDAADDLGDRINRTKPSYFLVNGTENRYYGIFSSTDMLIYLSELTKRDMETARKIQKSLVKDFLTLTNGDYEIVCSSIMASELGGDFYHIKEISRDTVFIAVCDVSGKGASASLISSMIIGLISIFDFSPGLIEFTKKLNQVFTRMFRQEKFMTGVFLLYNRKTGIIEYCDMGHSHLYLHSSKKLRLLPDRAGMPIGVEIDIEIESSRFKLNPGETFIIITDGILEQTNSAGKAYPLNRMTKIINENTGIGLKGIIIRILEDFHRFKGMRSAHDDSTIFMLKHR